MTHRTDEAPRRDVIARWCTLAEQRLDHLTEMFESGRWRRFHTEVVFLENIREAKLAVETWRRLSTPGLVHGDAAIEAAPATSKLAQGVAAIELALSKSAVPFPARAVEPHPVSIAPEPFEPVVADERMAAKMEPALVKAAVSKPVVDMLALEHALDGSDVTFDLTAIEQRYPLLRNAL